MTKTIVANLLESGISASLTYTVRNEAGEILTLGHAVEDGNSAIYSATITDWRSFWSGTIIWANNGVELAREDFQRSLSTEDIFENSINSYISVQGARAYFSRRLNTEPWDEATETNKIKALAQATELIDRLNFRGMKASKDQVLQWPRILHSNRLSCFPSDIQKATAELALNLLDGVDPDLEDDLISSQSDAYAAVRVTSNPNIAKDHVKAGIISISAWRLLLPWLVDPRSIRFWKG